MVVGHGDALHTALGQAGGKPGFRFKIKSLGIGHAVVGEHALQIDQRECIGSEVLLHQPEGPAVVLPDDLLETPAAVVRTQRAVSRKR